MLTKIAVAGGLFAMLGLVVSGLSSAESTPAPSDPIHLGVATCAGSPCHGAASNKKTNGVLQNEYLTWQRLDKHAKAFTALEGDLGKRIANNLGIGAPQSAKLCLDCHADNVLPEQRGVQFHLEDGVGCESCHGGSQQWLGPHASGKIAHADLVDQFGLAATDRPIDRARICISCHFGDENRFVTHRLYGAGHPRLVFELQTFTQIEPAHFVVDDVYRKRKIAAQAVQVWAVGQAMMLERRAEMLRTNKSAGAVFPELAFFDCQSCHHPMSALRWNRRDSAGIGPGVPHFDDADAIMLYAAAGRIAPELGHALATDMLELHAGLSAGQGNPADAAGRVATDCTKLVQVFAAHEFTKPDVVAILGALAARASSGDVTDYAAAEQMTMAMASLIYSLKTGGEIDGATYQSLHDALDRCYAATQKPDSYQPAQFTTAANAVMQAAR